MTGRRAFASLVLFVTFFTLCPLFSAHALNDGQIVKLINNYRRGVGLKVLKGSVLLSRSSRLKVTDMIGQGYFGHTNPAGEPFHANFSKAGYTYGQAGEILATGCVSEKCVIDAWLRSPPHRHAMLDPGYRDIGCSSLPAPRSGYYVVCHLGNR